MDFSKLERQTEILTLHEVLDEIDYYRLLQVPSDCTGDVIEKAFRNQTRALHPDKFFSAGDAELRERAHTVFRAVNEAWRTLKDPALRAAYDQRMAEGNLRINSEQADKVKKENSKKANLVSAATHPQAVKYWEMALSMWQKKDWKGCSMNIQFALTFEPDNQTFWKYLEKAKAKVAEG